MNKKNTKSKIITTFCQTKARKPKINLVCLTYIVKHIYLVDIITYIAKTQKKNI